MNSQLSALIIDDEDLVGLTIKTMLNRAGIKAQWTPDPDYFLELLAENRPNVVLIDLSMPGTDGVSMLKRVSQVAPKISVVLISGEGRRLLEAAGRSAEAHGLKVIDILEKPFHAEQIIGALISSSNQDLPDGSGASQYCAQDKEKNWLLSIEQIQAAIENGDIVPFFQPKIDCKTQALVGAEILARWFTKAGQLIYPDEFIPAIEEAGLITKMTLSLAEQAFAWMTSNGFNDLSVSLNLSAYSLVDENFPQQLQFLVEQSGLSTRQIILELTETSAEHIAITTLDSLTRLSLRGFQLSMDDFGTGYSSVARLTHMPFNELKVDRQFVSKMLVSDQASAVVDMIITLGKRLRMTVVAEGVEDEETFNALCKMGCDQAQGHFFGRPEPDSEFVAKWRDPNRVNES